jgi:MFS superfamily sulfate permease-like transporter
VRLWKQRRTECALAIAAFLGVALLGVLPGIAVAVALSIYNVFRRSWWPYQATLGRVDGLPGLHDTAVHPEAALMPGLIVFRFDAPLIFANARTFRERITAFADETPDLRWILLAAEPITDVDTTAAAALDDLVEELEGRGITLAFAELKDPVRERLRRYGALERVPDDHIYPTVGTAVSGYLRATGQAWRDWEETPDEGASERP